MFSDFEDSMKILTVFITKRNLVNSQSNDSKLFRNVDL